MNESGTYMLGEVVDLFLIRKQIQKRKYYASHLINAQWVWKKLYQNTIYSVQSEWKQLQKGSPYNYVELPKDKVRFFSASVTDDCNRNVALYYDETINVVSKPQKKACGCNACDCGDLCGEINNLVYTTKLIFTVSGIDYYEKIWLKLCPNGDIIEYREVPVKKYNDFVGEGGDFSNDYNNDYNIENPFANYNIVTEKFQKTLCKLSVKSCGCPESTIENENIIHEFCGGYLQNCSSINAKKCVKDYANINNNCLGSVKLSDCGNKLYFIPDHRQKDVKKRVPDFILINYQTSGIKCNSAVQVPEFAVEPMIIGLDHYHKMINDSFSMGEKDRAKFMWEDAENDLILYLNNFTFDNLSKISDARILW